MLSTILAIKDIASRLSEIDSLVYGTELFQLSEEIGNKYFDDGLKYLKWAKSDPRPELHISQAAVSFRNSSKFFSSAADQFHFKDLITFNTHNEIAFKYRMKSVACYIIAGFCYQIIGQVHAKIGSMDDAKEKFLEYEELFYKRTESDLGKGWPAGSPAPKDVKLSAVYRIENSEECLKMRKFRVAIVQIFYNAGLGDSYLEEKLYPLHKHLQRIRSECNA